MFTMGEPTVEGDPNLLHSYERKRAHNVLTSLREFDRCRLDSQVFAVALIETGLVAADPFRPPRGQDVMRDLVAVDGVSAGVTADDAFVDCRSLGIRMCRRRRPRQVPPCDEDHH